MPGSLCVIGSDTLLTASIAALLREGGFAVQVELPQNESSGVRVAHGPSGSWMFVSANRGPDADAVQALSQGASATLNLDSRRDELDLGVGALLDGAQGYVPIDMMRWIAGEVLNRNGQPTARPILTVREREVLRLVARGLSNAEIARALTISTNTVRTHLHALSVKLEATSRTKMLANARALAITEAFDSPAGASERTRVPA